MKKLVLALVLGLSVQNSQAFYIEKSSTLYGSSALVGGVLGSVAAFLANSGGFGLEKSLALGSLVAIPSYLISLKILNCRYVNAIIDDSSLFVNDTLSDYSEILSLSDVDELFYFASNQSYRDLTNLYNNYNKLKRSIDSHLKVLTEILSKSLSFEYKKIANANISTLNKLRDSLALVLKVFGFRILLYNSESLIINFKDSNREVVNYLLDGDFDNFILHVDTLYFGNCKHQDPRIFAYESYVASLKQLERGLTDLEMLAEDDIFYSLSYKYKQILISNIVAIKEFKKALLDIVNKLASSSDWASRVAAEQARKRQEQEMRLQLQKLEQESRIHREKLNQDYLLANKKLDIEREKISIIKNKDAKVADIRVNL